MGQAPAEPGPVGRAQAGLLGPAQHGHAAVVGAPLLGQIGGAVGAAVVDHQHLGLGDVLAHQLRAPPGRSRPRCRWAAPRAASRPVTLEAGPPTASATRRHGRPATDRASAPSMDADGRRSRLLDSSGDPERAGPRRPDLAGTRPPRCRRSPPGCSGSWPSWPSGAIGGFIGYAFTDLQCHGVCATPDALGGLVGALIGAVGVAVVVVLALRAMGEWKTIQHRPTGPDRPALPRSQAAPGRADRYNRAPRGRPRRRPRRAQLASAPADAAAGGHHLAHQLEVVAHLAAVAAQGVDLALRAWPDVHPGVGVQRARQVHRRAPGGRLPSLGEVERAGRGRACRRRARRSRRRGGRGGSRSGSRRRPRSGRTTPPRRAGRRGSARPARPAARACCRPRRRGGRGSRGRPDPAPWPRPSASSARRARQLDRVRRRVAGPLVAPGAHHQADLGALVGPPGQRAGAGHLRIVGMGVHREHPFGGAPAGPRDWPRPTVQAGRAPVGDVRARRGAGRRHDPTASKGSTRWSTFTGWITMVTLGGSRKGKGLPV